LELRGPKSELEKQKSEALADVLRPSPIAYRLSPIAYRLSPIAYRLSPIASIRHQ